MSRCCIALGGNTGDPELSFSQALVQIQHHGAQVLQSSSSILTPAMGASAGGEFLNAAAVLETDLGPADVLQLLHHVEAGFGRKRSIHWGPRVIDLDLLFFEQQVIDSDEVVVPHPCLWYRRFVLEPLVQIASDWMHPTLKESVADLHRRLKHRPLNIEIVAAGQGTAGILQKLAETILGDSRVTVSSVDESSPQSPDVFARLVEDAGTNRTQPAIERSRTVRVALNNDDDATAVWSDFLRNFGTAVFGGDVI